MMSTITVPSLVQLIGNINIIDIRNSASYNNNHIPGAQNIEYSLLLNNPDKYLNKNDKYYFYCTRGITSHKLCSYLSKLGYDVVNVAGGYKGYILEK